MKELALSILTPKGEFSEAGVMEIYLATPFGPLGILPDHAPFIAELSKQGVLRYKKDGVEGYFALTHGMAYLQENRLTILTRFAKSAASLEEANALLEHELKAENDISV